MKNTQPQSFCVGLVSTTFSHTTSGKSWTIETKVDLHLQDATGGWASVGRTFDDLESAERYREQLEQELLEDRNSVVLNKPGADYTIYCAVINYPSDIPIIRVA